MRPAVPAGGTLDQPQPSRALAPFLAPIALIVLPVGIGAPDPGCAKGPDTLLAHGIEERLRALGRSVDIIRLDAISTPPRGASGRRDDRRVASDTATSPIAVIRQHSARLAAAVVEAIRRGFQPLVLGGDHACAIGTWKGAAQARSHHGPLGLIWLDAHLDAHTPSTTPSGMVHGMPLAVLLGHGDARLVGLTHGVSIDPRHLCLVGVRSFEVEEARLLAGLGVRIIDMTEIRAHGLDAALREAVAIASNARGGWGISIDLDVLDPFDAPGVGSPVENGLNATALIRALSGIASYPGFVGAEMAEYNPALDPLGTTRRVADALLASAFSGALRA